MKYIKIVIGLLLQMGCTQSVPCTMTIVSGEERIDEHFSSLEEAVKVLGRFLDVINDKAVRRSFVVSIIMNDGTRIAPPIYEVNIFGDRYMYFLNKEMATIAELVQKPVNWKY